MKILLFFDRLNAGLLLKKDCSRKTSFAGDFIKLINEIVFLLMKIPITSEGF